MTFLKQFAWHGLNHRHVFAAALAAGLLAGMVCPAGAAPSFDCMADLNFREKAVCRDQRLASLDQDMAAAYARATARLDSADAAKLRQDQRDFLSAIDSGFEHLLLGHAGNTSEDALNDALDKALSDVAERHRNLIGEIEDEMGRRVRFLRSLDPGRRTLTGKWQNASTTLSVTRDGAEYAVAFKTFLPGFSRYNCEFVARFATDRGGLRADAARSPPDEEVPNRYTLQRRGATLELRETAMQPSDRWNQWICRHDSELHRVLFPVSEAE